MVIFFSVHQVDKPDVDLMRQFANDCGFSELAVFSPFAISAEEGVRIVTEVELATCQPKLVVATSMIALLSFAQLGIDVKKLALFDLEKECSIGETPFSLILQLLNRLNIACLTAVRSKFAIFHANLRHGLNSLYLPIPTFPKQKAIMDRRNRPRIFLEVSHQVQYPDLCKMYSYIVDKNIETWLFYKGEIPAWAKPDLLIGELPANEIAMYYSSCDYIVFLGDISNIDDKIFLSLSNDSLPIVFGEANLEKVRDYGLDLPFHDIAFLEALPLSVSILEEERSKVLESQTKANQRRQLMVKSLKLNLESKTTDVIDLSLLGKGSLAGIVKENKFVSKLINSVLSLKSNVLCESKPATIVLLEGWGISSKNLSALHPLLYFRNEITEIQVERRLRSDVTEVYAPKSDIKYGFNILFVLYGNLLAANEDVVVHLLSEDGKFITLDGIGGVERNPSVAKLSLDELGHESKISSFSVDFDQLKGGRGPIENFKGQVFYKRFKNAPNKVRFTAKFPVSPPMESGYLLWSTSEETGLISLPKSLDWERAIDVDLPIFLHSAENIELGIWVPSAIGGEAWFTEVLDPA